MANDTPILILPPLAGEGWEGLAAYFYNRDIGQLGPLF